MFRQKKEHMKHGILHFAFSISRNTLECYLIFGVWSYWLSNYFVTFKLHPHAP